MLSILQVYFFLFLLPVPLSNLASITPLDQLAVLKENNSWACAFLLAGSFKAMRMVDVDLFRYCKCR